MPKFAKPFFDTNILLYSVSDDARSYIANELLRIGGAVSVQVLNEFIATSRGKYRKSWAAIHQNLNAIRLVCRPVLPLTPDTHELALRLAEEYRYHIYDATILASAIEAGCDVLYSEDMQHNQKIGALVIRNPFR